MLRKIFLGTFLLFSAWGMTAEAQTVDEIVDKHVEAIGGYDQWRALKSLKVVSRSDSFSFNQYWKKPNLLRIDVRIVYPLDWDIRAFDGTAGWRINPSEGSKAPRSMSTAEIEDLVDQGDYLRELIDYKKKGHRLELLGMEAVGGNQAFKLKLTEKNGKVQLIFLDSRRFIELKRTMSVRDPQGGTPEIVVQSGDYKMVGGLYLAHRVGDAVREYHVNEPIDDGLFMFPPRQKETEKAKPQASDLALELRDPERRARILKDHPEADANKDGTLDLEEAWTFQEKQKTYEELLPVGDPAPDWELTDPEGKKHKLSDYRGKTVVLDFWAVWCLPCHRAMQGLQKLHEKYGDKGLVVLGISTWEQGGDPARLMKDKHFTYGLLLEGESIAGAYHVEGLPTIYVIGGDGRILSAGFGANEATEQKRTEIIENYLRQQGKL